MSTKWYKKAKTPRLWRDRIKQTLNPDDPHAMTDATTGDIEESSQMTDVGESIADTPNFADMGTGDIKRGAPDLIAQYPDSIADEDGQDAHFGISGKNKHRHPLMQFVGLFNDVTSMMQTEDAFDIVDIHQLIQSGEAILDSLKNPNEYNNLAESLDNIYELKDQIADREPFDIQYETWFFAYNYLRRTGAQFAKYTADVESPDVVFDYDDEFLPEEAQDNLEAVEAGRDGIDEFYGISESAPPPASPINALASDEDDYYRGVDEFLVPRSFMGDEIPEPMISPKMLKSWKSRHGVHSVKHSLSLRQLLRAYEKARSKVMANNGGWVLSSTLFTGLSKWELDALIEEGLVKVQGGKMTLTRLGYEKPQWYRY